MHGWGIFLVTILAFAAYGLVHYGLSVVDRHAEESAGTRADRPWTLGEWQCTVVLVGLAWAVIFPAAARFGAPPRYPAGDMIAPGGLLILAMGGLAGAAAGLARLLIPLLSLGYYAPDPYVSAWWADITALVTAVIGGALLWLWTALSRNRWRDRGRAAAESLQLTGAAAPSVKGRPLAPESPARRLGS